MPLYEYECAKDGVFELMQKFSDPPLAACPKCGGPVEKLLSAPAIQFKGTGWYVTDYARKGKSEGTAKGEKSESKDAKDSGSSSAKDGGSSSTPATGSGASTDKK